MPNDEQLEDAILPDNAKAALGKVFHAVFINGHKEGSLMSRMQNVEKSQAEMQKTIDGFLAKLLLYLSIFATLIAILTFLGPSIRKSMGMANIEQPVVAQTDAGNQPHNP